MEGVATTKLTTIEADTPRPMTAKEVALQLKYRAALHCATLNRARGRIKENLRAEGKKVSWFSAREISELAEQLLEKPGERERLRADCEGWVRELVFKAKR
jgi:hypothetical protein